MRISLILTIVVLLIVVYCVKTDRKAEPAQTAYWKVLLAEAASEGEIGMRAVACVIRNRGGGLKGLYGAQRKDLDKFCQRQGPHFISAAKRIAREVFEEDAPDITDGATLFENIERFGFPKDWDRSKVVQTCKIKRHTFFREK